MMLHDSIEHTGLVAETQARVSNDASRPQGIIGTICYESPLGVTRSFTPGPLQFKAPSKVSENISEFSGGCASSAFWFGIHKCIVTVI